VLLPNQSTQRITDPLSMQNPPNTGVNLSSEPCGGHKSALTPH
jgi:hypothetical protein